MGRFVITKSKSEEYTFELIALNWESIISGPYFPTLESCENGIDSVRRHCNAEVEDTTVDGSHTIRCPKYEIYKNRDSQFCFRLKATNGQIIAVSQAYTSKASCCKGIESVAANAPDAETRLK